MAVAVLRWADDDLWVTRFTLHSHHLAKLDRFLAEARRHALRSSSEFLGLTVEIDAAGAISVHAAGLEPLMLGPDRWISADRA